MSDIRALAGRPVRMTAPDGEAHDLAPLTFEDYGDLQAWLDAQWPDPFALARGQMASGEFSLAQQQFLLRVALELAAKPKPKLGTEDADALVRSVEGQREVLYLSIRKAEPGFTRDDAARFHAKLAEGEQARAMALSEADRVAGDPKAP